MDRLYIDTKNKRLWFGGIETHKLEWHDYLPGKASPIIILKEQGGSHFASRGYQAYGGVQ